MQSNAEKALKTIKPSDRGLPKTWPALQYARKRRQYQERDGRILLAYLKADDKDAEINRLADIWNLQPGHIFNIVKKAKADPSRVAPEFLTKIEAYRLLKREQIMTDAEEFRCELAAQIHALEEARADGEKWAEIEFEDKTGDREGTKTKKMPINDALKHLKAEMVKSHEQEGQAIKPFTEESDRPSQHLHVHLQADKDFRYEFDRMRSMEAEAEEVKDTQEGEH